MISTFRILKGQCHEVLCMRFVASKFVPQPPDSKPKAVSKINSNSSRYSNSKLIPCCAPPPPTGSNPRLWPPRGGSNPMVWPPPGDRILRCGLSRRIESYGVAPPAGSNSTVWPSSRDWGSGIGLSVVASSGGIRLFAVAPPGGSDFPL